MTLDELKKHHLFTQLSRQQRIYVVARCMGQDGIAAAKEAWPLGKDGAPVTEASAAASANRAERHSKIKWLINEFNGGNPPTKEELIKTLWQIVTSTSEPGPRISSIKLISQLSGFEGAPVPPDTPPADDSEENFDL